MKKRHWLRGGLIAIILLPILFFAVQYILIKMTCVTGGFDTVCRSYPLAIFLSRVFTLTLALPATLIDRLPNLFIFGEYVLYISIIIIQLLYFFLIGAIIGCLYGKFKNRTTTTY